MNLRLAYNVVPPKTIKPHDEYTKKWPQQWILSNQLTGGKSKAVFVEHSTHSCFWPKHCWRMDDVVLRREGIPWEMTGLTYDLTHIEQKISSTRLSIIAPNAGFNCVIDSHLDLRHWMLEWNSSACSTCCCWQYKHSIYGFFEQNRLYPIHRVHENLE